MDEQGEEISHRVEHNSRLGSLGGRVSTWEVEVDGLEFRPSQISRRANGEKEGPEEGEKGKGGVQA